MAWVLSALITEGNRNRNKVIGFCVHLSCEHIVSVQTELTLSMVRGVGGCCKGDRISITMRAAMVIDQEP